MRTLKFLLGVICLMLALIPGLLALGELTFYFDSPCAICGLGLIGVSGFLIAKRNMPLAGRTRKAMVLVTCLLVGFLALVVVPEFVAATLSRAANPCINNLRQIEAAKEEWALDRGKANGDLVTDNDIKPYIKLDSTGNLPKCPLGGSYTIGRVGEDPKCSIGTSAWPNDHVLSETNHFWGNVTSAYGALFGLRHVPQP
jgi:hypothetical protein